MPLSDEDVREILRIIDESDLDELRLETENFTLHVRKGGATPDVAPAENVPSSDGLTAIEAPMLGTFYRAEGPGEKPFVDVGSVVEPDTIVCIIEVMKMMNSIPAGVSGQVVEVCAENAELVEYGAPMFRVQPR
jgi:acetyl-CoA carboxylase biotin carboxyl carrier protein